MSSRGYIKLYRSLFKHEFFRPSKFSEREAFTWLISEAAWKPRHRRVGQFFVDIERGELVASLRHLAEVWMWEVGSVRGFLSRSERSGMLNTRSDKGISVITICNYDVYQGDEQSDNTVPSKVPAQSQHSPSTVPAQSQHNTEERKQSIREEGEERETTKDTIAAEGGAVPIGLVPIAEAQQAEMAEPSARSKAVSKRKKRSSELTADQQAAFNEWYAAYPRHESPGTAEKAYVKALRETGVTVEQLLDGARRYAHEKREHGDGLHQASGDMA